MTRKKGKPVNFDVIVKFFLQHYDIPTRTDIDRVVKRPVSCQFTCFQGFRWIRPLAPRFC